LFGVNQVGEVADKIRQVLEELHEGRFDLVDLRAQASKRIIKSQTTSASHYDNKRKEPTKYKVNDYVMVKNVDVTCGINKKLILKFKGPYVVKKVLEHDRYIIKDVEDNQLTQKPYEGIVGNEIVDTIIEEMK